MTWQSSAAVEIAAPVRASRGGSVQPRASSKITGDPSTLAAGRYDADGARVKRTATDGDTIFVGSYGRTAEQATGGDSNLVANPGFESGTWTEVVSSSWDNGTSKWRGGSEMASPRAGTYGYGISNMTHGHLLSDPINVTPGSSYEAKSFVRGMLDADDGEGTNWKIRASFYDANGSEFSSVDVVSGDAASLSLTSVQFGADAVALAGALTMRVKLFMIYAQGWVSVLVGAPASTDSHATTQKQSRWLLPPAMSSVRTRTLMPNSCGVCVVVAATTES